MPQPLAKKFTDSQTILFMVILSLVCAAILAILASVLARPQEEAKELDRSKQMMIAAHLLSHESYFLVDQGENRYVPAKYVGDGLLVPDPSKPIATKEEILDIYRRRLIPLFVNDQGEIKTPQEVGIDVNRYVAEYKKTGYYRQSEKLIYEILPNVGNKPIGYVIPINGYGLWDAIYGYLAIKTDGDTVIGITWYDQKETPGLGANIAETSWQSQFPGKKVFQPSPNGSTDFKTAPLGIVVVRGKVTEVLGNSPKAQNAVDGMAGATLTGNGVMLAYKDVLSGYRPFLMKLQEKNEKK